MKKVLITALCLVMVGSVLLSAKGPNGPKGPKGPKDGECECVQIVGVITDISGVVLPVDLTIDDEVVVTVNELTIIKEKKDLLTVGQLEFGDLVKICAQVDGDGLIACKINVKGVCPQ